MFRNIWNWSCSLPLRTWLIIVDMPEGSSCLRYWVASNSYGWTMLQKLPVKNFQQRNDKFNFYEKLTKDTYQRLMLGILRNYIDIIEIFHFYLIKWKLINVKNFHVIFSIRKLWRRTQEREDFEAETEPCIDIRKSI